MKLVGWHCGALIETIALLGCLEVCSVVFGQTLNKPSPPPTLKFLGLAENAPGNNPPDTQGAVGPDQVMTVSNFEYRFHDKAGGVIFTTPDEQFWAGYLNPAPIKTYDPRVLYDPFENRWILSAGCNDFGDPNSGFVLAVSRTSNPLGGWYAWRFVIQPTSTHFVDLPQLGFNQKWIVVRFKLAPILGGSNTNKVYIFNKLNRYAGDVPPPTIRDVQSVAHILGPMYDNSIDTFYMPFIGLSSNLGIDTITGAFGQEIVSTNAPFSTDLQWFQDESLGLPQKGTTATLAFPKPQNGGVVYRNGSIWLTHTVTLPATNPTHAAIQWWQISPSSGVQQRGVLENTTGFHFAYSSIAVNRFNDVLIGYSAFSVNEYVSANYAFRHARDETGKLRQNFVMTVGDGLYEDQNRRFGDYSATTVDPVNDASLWTIQEYAASPNPKWGLSWGKIVPRPMGDFDGDGRADLILQNGGSMNAWFMNGANRLGSSSIIPSTDGSWRVKSATDINLDGKTDLVFQDSNWYVAEWNMNGTNMITPNFFNPNNPGPGWRIVGTGDVDRDTNPDLLWQHDNGQLATWFMDGINMVSPTYLNPSGPGDTRWRVVGTGDFNKDGKVDLLWQFTEEGNGSDGLLAVWYMNGIDLISSEMLVPSFPSNAHWRVVATEDYNRDGNTDIIFQFQSPGSPEDGDLGLWLMNGRELIVSSYLNPQNPGAGWSSVAPK